VQEGQIDGYLAALDERSPTRLSRLPRFPAAPAAGGVLGKREPRYKRSREEISDAIDWLRQAGLLPALGSAGHDAMVQAAESLRGKPLQGLRECLNIVEREIALRLSLVDRIQTQVDPMAMLQERCLEGHGFGILPPGIALPESVRLIIRSLIQPPAEIYVTWCLDLRDMKLKPCAEILP
jgi:DNA-binding transcriptional LysR family regulator